MGTNFRRFHEIFGDFHNEIVWKWVDMLSQFLKQSTALQDFRIILRAVIEAFSRNFWRIEGLMLNYCLLLLSFVKNLKSEKCESETRIKIQEFTYIFSALQCSLGFRITIEHPFSQ